MQDQRQRRTQAERSATTRQSLLDATITVLHEHGYGATTTIMVAEQAGISRGAMLHQFRTKADLMTFVVEEVYALEVEQYHKILEGTANRRERLLAYPDAAWKVLSQPSGVAVLEILQGSRSDAVLAEKLRPIQEKIEADSMRHLEEEMGQAPSRQLLRLIVWAVRGLSIANVLASEREFALESIQLLRILIETGMNAGLFKSEAAPANPEAAPAKPKATPAKRAKPTKATT